jgi:lipopolysaccharide export system permease protein
MRFERNDIRVPDSEPGDLARPESMRSIPALLDEPTASAMAELHWRLSAPLATLLLALLALPLAHTPPRSARYGGLLVALLGYVVYMNLLGIGRAWMAAEVTPIWLGLWWPHGLVLLAIWWLQWWDRRPFSRRVPA